MKELNKATLGLMTVIRDTEYESLDTYKYAAEEGLKRWNAVVHEVFGGLGEAPEFGFSVIEKKDQHLIRLIPKNEPARQLELLMSYADRVRGSNFFSSIFEDSTYRMYGKT